MTRTALKARVAALARLARPVYFCRGNPSCAGTCSSTGVASRRRVSRETRQSKLRWNVLVNEKGVCPNLGTPTGGNPSCAGTCSSTKFDAHGHQKYARGNPSCARTGTSTVWLQIRNALRIWKKPPLSALLSNCCPPAPRARAGEPKRTDLLANAKRWLPRARGLTC